VAVPAVNVVDVLRMDREGRGAARMDLREAGLDLLVVATADRGVALDLVEQSTGEAAADVEEQLERSRQLAVAQEPGLPRLEEALRRIVMLDREGEPVWQVDVVVIPDEEQIVRGQGGRRVGLFAEGAKSALDVDNLDLRMLEQ